MSVYHQPPVGFVSHVTLHVMNLEKSVDFYKNVLRMRVIQQDTFSAHLSANGKDALVSLIRLEHGIKKQPKTTGLYHLALLLPNRKELGKVLQHFIDQKVPLHGASDHGISEAIYLSDPEGNGIEIAADTDPSTWKWKNGQLDVFSDNGPMNVRAVLNHANHEPFLNLHEDTILGHIHLHGSELKDIRKFYEDGLQMDVVIDLPRQALFFSYGNYHHHLAVNVWNGIGAPQPASNSVGLSHFDIILPIHLSIDQIKQNLSRLNFDFEESDHSIITKDPSGNSVIIKK